MFENCVDFGFEQCQSCIQTFFIQYLEDLSMEIKQSSGDDVRVKGLNRQSTSTHSQHHPSALFTQCFCENPKLPWRFRCQRHRVAATVDLAAMPGLKSLGRSCKAIKQP